jgi:hypothetical protein
MEPLGDVHLSKACSSVLYVSRGEHPTCDVEELETRRGVIRESE